MTDIVPPVANPAPRRRRPAAPAKILAAGVAVSSMLLMIGLFQMRESTGPSDAAASIREAQIDPLPQPTQTIIVIYRSRGAASGRKSTTASSGAPPSPAKRAPVVVRRVVRRRAHTTSKAS